MDHPLYNALRVVHLLSLVGWLGLSTGAWLLLRRLERDVKVETLWPAFAKVVDAEHCFLGLLIASGVALMFVVGVSHLHRQLWFILKLAILLAIVIPVECGEIYLTSRLAREPSKERIASYKRFLWIGGSTILMAATVIVILGKFRPGI